MSKPLTANVALVTGGSRGIGAACGCPRMGAGPQAPLAGGTCHLPGALCASGRLYFEPETTPKPHAPIMCAGNSETGLRFTVEEAQASFMNAPTHAEAAATSRRAKRIAVQLVCLI